MGVGKDGAGPSGGRVPAEVLASVGATVAALLHQYPDQVTPVLGALPPHHQAALRHHMPIA